MVISCSESRLICRSRSARLSAAAADQRADLDLQISLLSEHEITKLATLVAAIAERLDVRTEVDGEMDEVQQDVAPEAVLDALEETGDERNLN